MPNRVVREGIISSDRVNQLSWAAEVFYRRLMSVVDDYGRFDGRASVIRGSAYILKLNQVSESDVAKWMDDCSTAGLIRFYEVEGKKYVEIVDFNQTVRIKRSKYPAPITCTTHAPQMISTCMPETKRESETESETRNETERLADGNFSEKVFANLPPSQAMIEAMFEKAGLLKSAGAEFFNEVEGRVGWDKINDWTKYTLAGISKRLTQKNFNNGAKNGRDQRREPAAHGTPFGKL